MPVTQTDTAIDFIITTAIESAVRSAREAAAAEGETVIAHRVVQHPAGHLVVWMGLAEGNKYKRARLGVWDGSDLVAPLTVSRTVRFWPNLRAESVSKASVLLQDWIVVDERARVKCPDCGDSVDGNGACVVPCGE